MRTINYKFGENNAGVIGCFRSIIKNYWELIIKLLNLIKHVEDYVDDEHESSNAASKN